MRTLRCTYVFAAVLSVAVAGSRVLPSVEASSTVTAASIPARYFSLLQMPVSLHAAMQADAKTKKKPSNQADTPLPEGKGKDVTKRMCGTTCHATSVFVQQRHTSEKWSSIIDNMISKGMEASDDDLATVNDYLATYLGPPAETTPAAPADPSTTH